MKRLISAALFAALSLTIWAVPAKRFTREVTMENGETATITRVGDEFGSWWVNKDGKLVNFNADGTCRISDETVAHRRAQALARSPRAQRRKTIGTPKALPKVLVVLVDYKDKAWTNANIQNAADQLNKVGYNKNGNIGSVREYFQDASNGAYNPDFGVYGPMTLANNMKYYGGNSYSGDDQNPQAMILEAAEWVHNQGVDLGEYDSDGDGAVDFFAVWYAGYSEAEDDGDYDYWTGEFVANHPELMWPHQWELSDEQSGVSDAERTFGNTMIDSYFVFSELRGYEGDGLGNRMSGIGTFCHEFSHALGLPDFYATLSNNEQTLKFWDVMDYGPYNGDGCIPPTYSAYERYFMKWMTPEVLNKASNDTLSHIMSANEAYMVSSDGTLKAVHASQAYFLLENRQKVKWDKELPGAGMMITKVTYNASNWEDNIPNDNVNSMGVDIIEAKSNKTGESYASDLFPTGATKYSPYTKYPITEITQLSDGRVAFKFMGGATDTSDDPTPVDPSEDPDGCVTDNFDNVSELATSSTGSNITEKLDAACDLPGWTGERLFAVQDHIGIRVGTSNAVGYITSPALGIECKKMQVKFQFSNHDNNAGVSVSVEGGGEMSDDLELVEGGESSFTILNATESTKVTFTNTGKKKRFYLERFQACSLDQGPITSLQQTQATLDVRVVPNGLQLGDMDNVAVFSAQGQTLYSGQGNRFVALSNGLYIVRSGKTAMKVIVR
ncbi:MAG: M6 family metalloprotease domain-containing protein [Paludibacteraceae bacterium]|nr:M6 family metalloprotease domain-containing protein [Paludibacteraceae bacterium]